MKVNPNRFIALSVFAIIFIVFGCAHDSMEQQIPTGQDVGSLERNNEQTRKEGAVVEKLIKGDNKEAQIENKEGVVPQATAAAPAGVETKVLINNIEVTGVTVFKPAHIRAIVKPYEGKELTLADFKTVADLITADYRKNGYVTSIAFLPPQKVENGALRITVAEGRVGKINLTGNRYFKRNLILHYIELKKADLFNYDVLRKDVNYINEHPDRNAKVVLEKGEGPSETDINVQLKDKLPIHATLGYNNYNSTFLGRDKGSLELKCNNLFGLDHVASIEGQMGDGDRYYLVSGRYLVPLTPRNKIGGYYLHVNQKLGGTVKALKIEGKGDVAQLYYSYKLLDKENFIMRVNPAFEYKNITNKLLGTVLSKDDIRTAKLGFDFDFSDKFNGRSVLTQEFDYGIPDIMGGLKSKDINASRVGSGGKFFKSVTNVARVQSLPGSTSLMLRGSVQESAYNLCSTEQFNVGGPSTVRGYPISEFTGDRGFTATAEVYVPPYLIPKTTRIPMTQTKIFDALRFVGFFDYGRVWTNNTQVGENKREQIDSAGPGIRFDIPNTLSVSFDYGVNLGQKASDGSKGRGYIETKLFF